MFKLCLFLRKSRFRKKWQVNKQVWLLSFDLTVLFYAVLFIGYIVTAIVLEGNLLQTIRDLPVQLRTITADEISILITVLPFVYLLRAFTLPGVLFSNTEYTLSILTFSRKQLWGMLAVEKSVKRLLLFSGIGLVYSLFSATSLPVVFTYVLILIIIQILMLSIEWKFFQLGFLSKIIVLFFGICINILNLLTDAWMMGLLFGLLLVCFHLLCYRTLFHHVDWKKVIAAADYKIWHMPLVSFATKVKFKKDHSNPFWHRLSVWKRPFGYGKKTVYHRLWQVYLEKNSKYLLQIIGVLLLMMAIMGYLKPWLFLLSIVLVIHIFTSFTAALFRDRFEADIVQVLPWQIGDYLHTFRFWVYPAGIIFIFPLVFYLMFQFTIGNLVVFALLCVLFVLLMEEKLTEMMQQMDAHLKNKGWVSNGVYIALVLAVLSDAFPIAGWGMALLTLILLGFRKRLIFFQTQS